MHAIETYLSGLDKICATGGGTRETSYYGVLENLLNEAGNKLKPKVRAVAQLANTGAGQPDFGLYTANQFQRAKDERPIEGAPPERGVIEVKDWADNSFLTARKEQVSKYWKKYGLVLVTNYRDFVLMGRDDGKPVRLETYRMAESESAFRTLLAHPRKTANEQGERLLDFLRRVLLYEAALTDPEDLAWFLASYAREARHRVEAAKELPALAGLKKGLEEALGMTFEGEKGEHFFQATLVQTLFYGVFSSWVLWSRDHLGQPEARFNWHEAGWTLHVPMVASLFNQIATPQKLRPLGVAEVLDWVGTALNRVDRPAFFSKFEEEHAVQYFYEPFLKAYDPELRKELGVWYTPPEIVQYQVERVDRVLREELDVADGLADDNVVILDPCCGTGAYLVETLKRIHKTLDEKGASALTAQKLKKAAMERVFGFEILPAPFVVSHLQLGLMLRRLGAPLDHDSDQRAGVYLTNALTGWEPLKEPKDQLPLFPELMAERDAANRVKQEAPILVILGNPPYNGYAGMAMDEERDLVTAYRTTKRAPKPEGQGLNDLYVRFFRMAERRIVEKSGKGIICYISNYSWLEGLSHPGMRESYLEVFDKIWIDCLNGDKYKTGKLTPWGESDPSIFSTETNREGIQVGTAISLLVKQADVEPTSVGPTSVGPTSVGPTSVGPPPPAVTFSSPPSAKPAHHDFRRHLPHFEGRGAPLFVTFSTKDRWELPPKARSLVLNHILHDHTRKMHLICAVVMPDHAHMLYYPWEDPEGNRYTKTEIVGAIKSASAHSINKALGRKGSVWQDESFDHVVRKEESIEAKAQYIIENPMRKTLCRDPDEYPFLWRAWVEGEKCVGPPPPAVASVGPPPSAVASVGPPPSAVDIKRRQTGEGAGPTPTPTPIFTDVKFRHLWGKHKHAEIQRNATGEEKAEYEKLSPRVELGYPLMPIQVDAGYLTWPQLPDLFPVSFPGVKTSRDEFLVDIDRDALEQRIAAYFDSSVAHEEIARHWPSVMEERKRYKAREIRDFLVRRGRTKGEIVRYAYRPFDVRWLYWEPETKLLDEKRSDYFPQVFEGNIFFFTTGRTRKLSVEPPLTTSLLNDLNFMDSGARGMPLLFINTSEELLSLVEGVITEPNISSEAKHFLREISCEPEHILFHCLAVGHSPFYRQQNIDGIRQDWPRIPLPAKKKALLDSAELGRRVAVLLDTEKPVDGVTCGKIDPRLKGLGVIQKKCVGQPPSAVINAKTGGGAGPTPSPEQLDPDVGELDLTAGWGHAGARGVTMPGRGKLEERKANDGEQDPLLGDTTLDIYLNDTAYWSNVPKVVWDYTIGGYQVIKKWLSYREKTMLGRGLKMEEAEYVTEMVRRIASLILLQPDLDTNYQAVKHDTWSWPQAE